MCKTEAYLSFQFWIGANITLANLFWAQDFLWNGISYTHARDNDPRCAWWTKVKSLYFVSSHLYICVVFQPYNKMVCACHISNFHSCLRIVIYHLWWLNHLHVISPKAYTNHQSTSWIGSFNCPFLKWFVIHDFKLFYSKKIQTCYFTCFEFWRDWR